MKTCHLFYIFYVLLIIFKKIEFLYFDENACYFLEYIIYSKLQKVNKSELMSESKVLKSTITRFSSKDPQLQKQSYLTSNEYEEQQNPLKKYLNYTKTITLKTLTEIYKVNQTKSSLQGHRQNSNNQEVMTMKHLSNHSLKVLEESFEYQASQAMQKKISTKLDFQSIKISVDSFLEVKEQPVGNYYEIKQKIGEGSFGTVFRAICKRSMQQRAIKVLKTKFLKDNQNKQFLDEMILLSKLQHPAIIKLYNLFKDKSNYYVVMQYCKGGSIIKMLKKMKVKSQSIIVNIIKQLLSALSYLHSLNIVHRDIKLDNIVFLGNADDPQNQSLSIKIIDFGTAVQFHKNVTENYPIAGTLSYLAPQVINKILVDKSDIWSAAVLMIILLTGVPPFKDKNQVMTKSNILNKEITFKQPQYANLSSQAKHLLGLMLKRKYKQRISAAQALKHPFFQNNNIRQKRRISYTNVQKLKNFYMQNNFISVIQSYLSLTKISQVQRQQLSKLFTVIDTDNSGTIQIEEFKQLMKKTYGDNYNEQEVAKLIKSIDKDQSGKIDFNEFIMVMYSRQKLFVQQSLNEAFDYFDKEKDGFLQVQDIRNILKGSQNKQVQYFINKLDKDKDNKISRQQFLNYFSKF